MIIQATCLPGKKSFFFLCSIFSDNGLSLEVSVGDFLEATRCVSSQEARSLSATLPVIVFDFCRSAIDLTDSISFIPIIASIGRFALEATSLLKFILQIWTFPNSALFRTEGFRLLFSWKQNLSPIYRAPSQEHLNSGHPGHAVSERTVERDKTAITRCCKRTRLHAINQGSNIVIPIPPLPTAADHVRCSSTCMHSTSNERLTSFREKLRGSGSIRYSDLVTGRLLL